jgi:hypothetical protein
MDHNKQEGVHLLLLLLLPVTLTRKSLSKPSICAAMAAELGREPRRSRCAADMGLLNVPVARLEACGDKPLYTSLS